MVLGPKCPQLRNPSRVGLPTAAMGGGGWLAALRARGLVATATHGAELRQLGPPAGVYLGIDPTADGLHVGHLLGVLTLRRLQLLGFKPLALVGGATGLIGDPSGRVDERQLLSVEKVGENVQGIRRDLGVLLDFSQGDANSTGAKLLDNSEWYQSMSALDLLRDVGKHFKVGTMLGRESVKSRMASRDKGGGLSFTEFSYQLLQGYDFLHLYQNDNCRLQIGGSDQWGNIVSGVELIKRALGRGDAFGLTLPLLTTSSGAKIGKSAGNAVWLSPEKTSDYAFYQYFVRIEDRDVEDLLLKLTHLEPPEIEAAMGSHRTQEHLRSAQKLLASTVTTMIRGREACERAELASAVLFGGPVENLAPSAIQDIASSGDVPSTRIRGAEASEGTIMDLVRASGLANSKSQIRRLIDSGGLYLNNQRVHSGSEQFDLHKHAIQGEAVLLRSGKRGYHIVLLE